MPSLSYDEEKRLTEWVTGLVKWGSCEFFNEKFMTDQLLSMPPRYACPYNALVTSGKPGSVFGPILAWAQSQFRKPLPDIGLIGLIRFTQSMGAFERTEQLVDLALEHWTKPNPPLYRKGDDIYCRFDRLYKLALEAIDSGKLDENSVTVLRLFHFQPYEVTVLLEDAVHKVIPHKSYLKPASSASDTPLRPGQLQLRVRNHPASPTPTTSLYVTFPVGYPRQALVAASDTLPKPAVYCLRHSNVANLTTSSCNELMEDLNAMPDAVIVAYMAGFDFSRPDYFVPPLDSVLKERLRNVASPLSGLEYDFAFKTKLLCEWRDDDAQQEPSDQIIAISFSDVATTKQMSPTS